MKKLFRWTGISLAALTGLILVAYLAVYVLSERELTRTWPTPHPAIPVPADDGSIAEGQRLALTRGCFTCHGEALEGKVLFDQPMLGTLVAPNLGGITQKYDDATLAGVIRNGVRPDGHSMMVMPSMALGMLDDADLGRLVAYLHTVPSQPGPAASVTLGPLGRIGIVSGRFKTMAQTMLDAAPPPPATNKDTQLGRYVARSGCAECHGTDLRGADHGEFIAPTLQIVNAYGPEDFTKLMRSGIALGGRSLDTMAKFASKNLSHLTDAEVASLYAYLHALPDPEVVPGKD
jgi:mono/diheme cytochrome c family protein